MRRSVARGGALVLGLFGGFACSGPREDAVIMVEAPPSGAVVQIARAVIDSTNRAGKYPIRLVTEAEVKAPPGEQYLIRATYRALEMVRRPGLVALVGTSGSTDALMVGSIYRGVGVLQVVPTGNAPQLARVEGDLFLMAPRLEEEVRFMADHVSNRLRAQTAVILYTPGAWGSNLQTALATALWERRVRVLQRLPVPVVDCDTDDGLIQRLVTAALQGGRPDVVVLATYNPCLIGAFERAAPGMSFVAGDGMLLRPGEASAASGRTFAVAFWSPSETPAEAADFRQRFEAVTGSAPTWADAAVYDAIMVVVTAVRAVGPDRGAVARYLRELGRNRDPYRGASGLIDFRGTRSGRITMEQPRPASRQPGLGGRP